MNKSLLRKDLEEFVKRHFTVGTMLKRNGSSALNPVNLDEEDTAFYLKHCTSILEIAGAEMDKETQKIQKANTIVCKHLILYVFDC